MKKANKKPIVFSNLNTGFRKKPNQDLIKAQQALVLVNQGKLIEAENIYRELIAVGTKNHTVYGNLAALCGISGKTNEIIGLLERALQIQPNYPEAHNNLGNDLKEKGNLNAAINS